MTDGIGVIDLYIVGGLGDVSLTRKLPYIFGELSDRFRLRAIADVHRASEVIGSLDGLLDGLTRTNLKCAPPEIVRTRLREGFRDKSIRYFDIGSNGMRLPDEFFYMMNGEKQTSLVDISTPNNTHFGHMMRVLGEDANILVEKPTVTSLIHMAILQSFIDSNGTHKGMDGDHYSHYPHIRDFIDRTNGEGFGLGRIKRLELFIEEKEGFDNGRNRNMINLASSGGGIWLDLGIHAVAFLRNIGGMIDYNSVRAQPFKCNHPLIRGREFGETAMTVESRVVPENGYGVRFTPDCQLYVSVGKSLKEIKKIFRIHYEEGRIELDIPNRTLSIYRGNKLVAPPIRYDGDPFCRAFEDMRDYILTGKKPLTTLDKSARNVRDVFVVYEKKKPAIEEPSLEGDRIYDESGFSSVSVHETARV